MTEEQEGQSVEQTPQQGDAPTQTPEPDLPDKFRDKTPAEIVKSYQELESQYGRTQNELGELKKENEAYVNWYNQAQAQQQQQPQQPVDDSDKWLDNPAGATREEIAKAQYQQRIQTNMSIAPLAFNQAKNLAPHLFQDENIAGKVQKFVQGAVASGGMKPEVMADPETYTNAAWIMYGNANKFQTTSPAPNPSNPVQTDAPAQVKSQEKPGVDFDENQRRMIRDFGFKPEDVAESESD